MNPNQSFSAARFVLFLANMSEGVDIVEFLASTGELLKTTKGKRLMAIETDLETKQLKFVVQAPSEAALNHAKTLQKIITGDNVVLSSQEEFDVISKALKLIKVESDNVCFFKCSICSDQGFESKDAYVEHLEEHQKSWSKAFPKMLVALGQRKGPQTCETCSAVSLNRK